MEQESNSGKNFARTYLPWIIGVAAFAFYLATLNHWASIFNLESVARINGWNWIPDMHAPLYSVVTFPFQLLPAGLVPIALNVFSAFCGAAALGLLARSVALLPHNKTDAQRQRLKNPNALLSISTAWIPLVLAACVCGLQLTFWEHTTGGSPELFDLLIFAYLIRCLLEYRLTQNEAWLTRSAFIYGLGITNNWAMIGFFPLFATALIWMMGWKFFNKRFLTRMALLGLAGLSLYLLMPLIQMFSHTVPLSFWQGLKGNIIGQKNILLSIPRKTVLYLSLTSLVPLFVLSIRWASYFGDPSPLGVALTTLIFHIAHAFFLLACIWISFDPLFSPRHMFPVVPFLTFYYLTALNVGYFSGYFLLAFNASEQPPERRRAPKWPIYVNLVVRSAVWVVMGIAIAGLAYKNLPIVRITNSPSMFEYSQSLTENIPPNAVMLSDDATQLRLAEVALSKQGREINVLALESQSLKWPQYHRYLHSRYGTNWIEAVDAKRDNFYGDNEIIDLIANLAGKYPTWYLNPSWGYYFEFLYPVPHGLAFELKKYESKQLFPPPLAETTISENDKFWRNAQSKLSFLTNAITPPPSTHPNFRDYFMDEFHLKPEQNITAIYMGSLYSLAMNNWGVELQKTNRLAEAAQYFIEAQELNPKNVVAAINERFNSTLRTGRKLSIEDAKSIEDKFGSYSSWNQVINQNGPFDDPTICLQQAKIYADDGQPRQAILMLDRVVKLAPDDFDARLLMARLYMHTHMIEDGLQLISGIRNDAHFSNLTSTNQTDLMEVECRGLFLQNKPADAEQLISKALRENPDNAYLLNSMLHVCIDFANYADALIAADHLLRINPDDTGILMYKGFLHMHVDDNEAAIATYSHVIVLQPDNYTAMLERAICYVQVGKLDLAKKDYEALQKILPDRSEIDFGLGEVAYQQHDTNAAIKNYESYLKHSPANTQDATNVIVRIKELKGGKP